jgi:hypothetical protein
MSFQGAPHCRITIIAPSVLSFSGSAGNISRKTSPD